MSSTSSPRPAQKPAIPYSLASRPKSSYVNFVNLLTTSAAGAKPDIQDPTTVTNPDGTVTVTLTGTLASRCTAYYGTLRSPFSNKIR